METRVDDITGESRRLTTEKVLDDLKVMFQRAEEKAVERAKAADKVIREHPYHTVGLAFGFGLLVGILVARRK